MALSPLRLKIHHHGRSLSLPSNIHPSVSQFGENLAKLKASETTSSSLSSMEKRVNGLRNLYCNIDDLPILPHIQQVISQDYKEKRVDQVLDGCIMPLEACSTAKDLCSETKLDIRHLLSALRRKDSRSIHSYQTSRKKSKKMVQKCLKELRRFRNKLNVLSLEKEEETTLVYMLKESESVTIVALESLLSYVVQAKQGGGSVLSKLMSSKKASYQGEETVNEFKEVDTFLQLIQEDDSQVDKLMNHLKVMDSSIQTVEEELECLFRKLIRTRVLILNVLDN
ncbi:hypothetical protein CDL12_01533 [Handroanthus impetiginosus]|uniref:Uncharacterized protein n=1 Tax=Handroanthus impetiginosus TaxID=429701 RepID=A0A2G9I7L1_9LAMI|nr:hypothetical protein CDL12_01533 [Handroanthus impetiginosus]